MLTKNEISFWSSMTEDRIWFPLISASVASIFQETPSSAADSKAKWPPVSEYDPRFLRMIHRFPETPSYDLTIS